MEVKFSYREAGWLTPATNVEKVLETGVHNEVTNNLIVKPPVRGRILSLPKVIELLQRSSYKAKLSNAGLFLRAIEGHADIRSRMAGTPCVLLFGG